MFGLSKAWLFGIGTAVAVAVVALLAWRALDTPIAPGAKPGSSALNLSQGDIAKADAVKAEAMKAEAAKQDAAKLDASKSDASKSDAAKSDASKAGTDNGTADGKSDGKGPTFDIVRVEPSGETVIAGRGAPDVGDPAPRPWQCHRRDQKRRQRAIRAWCRRLSVKGEHLLSLQGWRTGPRAPDRSRASRLRFRQPGKGEVIVALAEPGAATRRSSPSPRRLTPATRLATSRSRRWRPRTPAAFTRPASAMPGATVQLYLNGAVVATVRAGEGGAWSLKIARGMAPGAYAVRADQIGRATAKSSARAEVPFDYPANRQGRLDRPQGGRRSP